jgi:tellurite resistance protein TerC
MSGETWMWIGFNAVVVILLILDLKVFHRKSHAIGVKEALLWSAFWIALSLLFNLGIYFWQGSDQALEFVTAYVVEKSLSVDNLFVFLLIFSYFAVPAPYQHKVLFWGILGAIVMRLVFILAGITLIEHFSWALYILGSILIIAAIRMAVRRDASVDPEKNPVVRLLRRIIPVTEGYEGDKFFVRRAGLWVGTPLLVVVVFVESTDIVFAVDSVPAVLGITTDTFIAYSSNVCAILGLRALYFALAGVIDKFKYLSYGLVIVLLFIGVKLLIANAYEMPVEYALGFVAVVLLLSVLASMREARRPGAVVAVADDTGSTIGGEGE